MRPKDEILNRYSILAGVNPSSADDILDALYPGCDATELLISSSPDNFSASVIARAVEDCGHHLVNLNMMDTRHSDSGRKLVALRLDSQADPDRLSRSLSRYGYEIETISAPAIGLVDEERSRRVAELLHILEI